MAASSFGMGARVSDVTRRRLLRRAAIGSAGVSAAWLLAACGGDDADDGSGDTPSGAASGSGTGTAAAEPPQKGGTLSIRIASDPSSMNPLTGFNSAIDHHYLFQLYDGITLLDENLQAKPGLALSWENPEPLAWIFKLRPGVKFHDGTDFNAAAVAQVAKVALDPSSGSQVAGTLGTAVERAEAVDTGTVRYVLKTPLSALPWYLSDRSGMVFSPAAYDKLGKDMANTPTGAGTGPYIFGEWNRANRIVLRRNPNYWDQPLPYLDEVVYRNIPDAEVAIQSLQQGEVLIIAGTGAVGPDNWDLLSKNKEIELQRKPANQFNMWYVNGRKAPFTDKRAALALSYALDRQGIEDSLKGTATVQYGFIPQFDPAFDPNYKPFPAKRDIAKAKEQLAAAGLSGGYTFKGSVASSTGQVGTTAELQQQWLAEAGIKMEFDITDATTIARRFQQGDYDVYLSQWAGRSSLDETAFNLYYERGQWNAGRAVNPEITNLLIKSREATDPEALKKIYREIQEKAGQDGWSPVTHATNYESATRKSVRNFRLYGDSKYHLRDVWIRK